MAAAESILHIMSILWTVFKWSWWVFLIGGMFLMKKGYERYPIDCVILESRGKNIIKTNDRAGRKFDKETQVTNYQLKKSKDTMPVYNFEWMLHNADTHMSIFEKIVMFLRPTIGTVFLLKYGSKQYKPINITKGTSNKLELKEIKHTFGNSIFKYEYAQFDPRWPLQVLDFEVVDWDNMNFMVQEQRATMMRRAGGYDWLKQLVVPAMMIAGAVIIGLFILKFSADVGADLRGVGPSNAQADTTPKPGGVISGTIDSALAPGA
jgi:hypothetical protein